MKVFTFSRSEKARFQKVLIITGGNSPERKISLLSARFVKKGLEEVGYKVKLFDLKKSYQQLKKISEDYDVIFPVLHGEEGEGGSLQKLLSNFNKPFVGGSWKGFKEGWYKIPFKKFCDENHIITSPWKKIQTEQEIIKFGFPCVLKASNGGSSKEVVILKSVKDLENSSCQKLLKSNSEIFVEEFLTGVEVTAAILDGKALPLLEIIPPKGEWFDYKNKYSDKTQEIPHAPSLKPILAKRIQKIALKIHQILQLGQYSRIDFIVSKGIPYALEINTIPGLTASSLFPKAALAKGYTFPKLLDKLVMLAYEKNIFKA